MSMLAIKPTAHIVDVLGNVIGRDQPILRIEKALEIVALLGEEIFADDNVIFFDPFCKAGELLLACAFHSCWAKAKDNPKLLDTDMVFKEIYESSRYFGLAPDERHHRLSIRTFLGNTRSHNENFNHIIRNGHYLSEEDGTLDKKEFERKFNSMIGYINSKARNKKIIAVGNPPYQEADGGFGKSAKAVYGYFVDFVEKYVSDENISIKEWLFVIPARWFGGGKGLDDFRADLITSHKIKNLVYFQNSSHVFPTVDINGGVCYLHYDKNHTGKTTFTDGNHTEILHLDEYDIIADDPKGYDIVRKVMSQWNREVISDVALARKAFGIPTNYFDKNESEDPKKVECYPCLNKGRSVKYIKKSEITKNKNKVDLWKVAVPKAAGGSKGKRRSTIPINQIFLIDKGMVTTETYNIIDCFETKAEAEKLISYLKTDFARYLLGLRKITQDLPADRWAWVPYVDLSKNWDDEKLYSHFDLSKLDQKHIRGKIEEWT